MKQVQIQAAEKAIALLKASGAQYKVIFDDGLEYGDLEVVVRKKHTRTRLIPNGVMSKVYKPVVNSAQVGDVLQFAIADVLAMGATAEGFRSACSAYASVTWGNGSYTSTITDTHIEILRIS